MRKKLAETGPAALLKQLHQIDRTVAVTVSKDGLMVSEFGHRTAYPVAGARVSVEQGTPRVSAGRVATMGVLALAAKKQETHLMFEGPGWVMSVRVPGKRKRVAEFAAAFNGWAASLGGSGILET